MIFVASTNSIPCLAPSVRPDVFGFDARTGTLKTSFTTGLMVGDIAVSPARELLAVDANCVGLISNHHPKMAVIDLNMGDHLRDVGAKGGGVRYRVAISRNGERVVAWTSHVKCGTFDWLDMNCYGASVKPTFTVWHLPDFEIVAKSQILSAEGFLRISSSGRYVLVYGAGTGLIYEVP
jgi:hypothetical protein